MNRSPLAAVLGCLAAVACSATDGSPNTSATLPAMAPASDAFARADVERDLVLTLRQPTSEAFERERNPRFEVVLSNRSRDRTYPIVKSSDGSEAGWREPHVYYTVQRRTPGGAWEAAPELPIGRCGNYDVDWTKDVVALAPGETIVLPWFEFIPMWDIAGASDVRIVAHYDYGAHARDLLKVPPALHRMPAYALVSNAIELPVEEPLVLELRVREPILRPHQAIAKAVDVVAVNKGARELPFADGSHGGQLSIEVEYASGTGVEHGVISTDASLGDASDTIAPGAHRSAVGSATASEYSGIPDGARIVRARARLAVSKETPAGTDYRVAESPWVDVR